MLLAGLAQEWSEEEERIVIMWERGRKPRAVSYTVHTVCTITNSVSSETTWYEFLFYV